jgi:hypothetical protein
MARNGFINVHFCALQILLQLSRPADHPAGSWITPRHASRHGGAAAVLVRHSVIRFHSDGQLKGAPTPCAPA